MSDTVGSLLAAIASSLQDAHRILMFADKRGWESAEFEQVRALEDALDEAKFDFQAMTPLVNGQFYYENDRRDQSIRELRQLQAKFDNHAQTFHNWIRMGGRVDPLWAGETASLRRQLHRAQCRAARRIFNADREDGGSGGRCLGAYLLYRQLRRERDLRRSEEEDQARERRERQRAPQDNNARAALPTWKAQQPWLHEQEQRRSMGRERLGRRGGGGGGGDLAGDVMEMSGLSIRDSSSPNSQPSPYSSQYSQHSQPSQHTPPYSRPRAHTRTHTTSTSSSSLRRRRSLEDLVPACSAIGTFQRFGDRDIAFVCDYCDGHIVWEDIKSLPTTRAPPVARPTPQADAATAAGAAAQLPATYHLPISTPRPPTPPPPPPSSSSSSAVAPSDNAYPRWQATAAAATGTGTTTTTTTDSAAAAAAGEERTIVFAPLAVANHLPPMGTDWEARLWCPYCDDYLYYDSSEGDQTCYAQDEHGFPNLAAFQEHLEWYHTAYTVPVMPAATDKCAVM